VSLAGPKNDSSGEGKPLAEVSRGGGGFVMRKNHGEVEDFGDGRRRQNGLVELASLLRTVERGWFAAKA